MKRKGFLKSLATFIAAPSLIESVGVEEPKCLFDAERINMRLNELNDEPPQWDTSYPMGFDPYRHEYYLDEKETKCIIYSKKTRRYIFNYK